MLYFLRCICESEKRIRKGKVWGIATSGFGVRVDHAEKWISLNWPEIEWFDIETVVPKYNKGFYESLGFQAVGNTEVQFPGKKVQSLLLRKLITSGAIETDRFARVSWASQLTRTIKCAK